METTKPKHDKIPKKKTSSDKASENVSKIVKEEFHF